MRLPVCPTVFVCALLSVAGATFAAGCSAGAGSSARAIPTALPALPALPAVAQGFGRTARTPHHILILVQENRSVENLFNGYPGADTQAWGLNSKGQRVPLHPWPLGAGDPDHSYQNFVVEYDNGKLDGFNNAASNCNRVPGCKDPATFVYAYVPRSQTGPYWLMASRWTFADHVLQTNEGPSYAAHQYLIAGQSGNPMAVDSNSSSNCGNDGNASAIDLRTAFPGTLQRVPACHDFATIFDELAAKNDTWKYYAPPIMKYTGLWRPTQEVRHLYNSPYLVSPETLVLSDIAAGTLPNVAYVVPDGANSDHPLKGATGGPGWVTTVVNAVGESRYWKDSLIIVVWDDWGGWYDHYAPYHPPIRPDDPVEYGFRVPLLLIGPYAKKGYISHKDRDFTALLNTIQESFDTAKLGQMDMYTDDLGDMVDFTQPARPFEPLPTLGRPPSSFFVPPGQSTPPDTE